MNLDSILLLVAGLVLLVAGAEALVRGASRLAAAAGVSALVIGLTVVAYGTSAPETAVSVKASFLGQSDIAVGNIVGSNIFNVLFILGVSALIRPLVVNQQLVRRDVPLMLGASLLTYGMALDGVISRLDGAILFAGIVAYTVYSIRESRRESAAIRKEYDEGVGVRAAGAGPWVLNVLFVLAGLALLVLGSRFLVDGAIEMAKAFGVSELVIGLTIVAAGTSLPEVATSILATIRGERDIAVGNVVGSNIYNLLGALGLSAIVAKDGLRVALPVQNFDAPVMVAVALACLPVFFTAHLIARWEGVLFLSYYAAYTAYLVLHAEKSASLPTFQAAMLGFFVPLTIVTLTILAVRSRPQTGAETA